MGNNLARKKRMNCKAGRQEGKWVDKKNRILVSNFVPSLTPQLQHAGGKELPPSFIARAA